MDYKDFYDLAEYANENWKGSFTQKEVACNAYDYLADYQTSKKIYNPTRTIRELYKMLLRDGSEECKCWAHEMELELPIKTKFGLVLKIKDNIHGLKADEIKKMIEMLNDNESYPVEFQARNEELCAMGFMTREFAKEIDYDYEKSGLHDFIANVLDSNKEINEYIYSFNGNLFYMETEDYL